ncbi:MAG TPA: HAMP domain-containing sensor histidine kinase, partial [Chthoniobacterales bacterium]|nr:HAMP domain-containing sensor histidine kinase [Chthoniobacterales bacterium]
MTVSSGPRSGTAISFRTKLLAAMMLVVSALTIIGLYFAHRNVAATAQRDLKQSFEAELSWLHRVQQLRNAALQERCRGLAAKPRIHAALEDNALDLLYPSAKDELHDLMQTEQQPAEQEAGSLHARFYRFLNVNGTVLPPPNPTEVGELAPGDEERLAIKKLPDTQQTAYLAEKGTAVQPAVDEVVFVPIFSSETNEIIAALVVGFRPFELTGVHARAGMRSGIWIDGALHLALHPASARKTLGDEVTQAIAGGDRTKGSFTVTVNGDTQLLFYERLNANSLFAPAYQVCIYPLTESIARQHRLSWQIGGAGALLLLGGFLASRFVAVRLAQPVEQLAIDSEENRAQRQRAEAALESTSEELERTARYSADASHQLKSPVTVLRNGIESLLAREDFQPEVYEELSGLLHQTRRLTSVIDDLLLLSRMDAGHLKIDSQPVNLVRLIEEWLEDLAALPDAFEVAIEKEFPESLFIAGEKRYTSLIVQNLLENARKYNRSGGRIRVLTRQQNSDVILTIGNTG